MDWIKIKAEHISEEYTDAEVGCLIRFQLLVFRYGRFPTQKELSKQTSIKVWGTLKQTMSRLGATPEQVASKVLEDREKARSKSEVEKLKKRNQREKFELSQGTKKNVPPLDKIRLDKIREDNTPISPLQLKTYGLDQCHSKSAVKVLIRGLQNIKYKEELIEKIGFVSDKDLYNDKFNFLQECDHLIQQYIDKPEEVPEWAKGI